MNRDDVKEKIDDAAEAAKKAVDKAADKAQEARRNVGAKVEKAGHDLKKSGR